VITTGSKWFYGLGGVALVVAVVHGYTTGGDRLGPLTAGYWGAVGDHLGYGLLLASAAVALLLGLVATGVRDADAGAVAQVAGTEAPPAVTPAGTSSWPAIAGFGVGVTALGLVIGAPVFALGCVILVAVIAEWAVRAWADRATGDPEVNRQVRNRLMYPIEIPAGVAIAIAVGVLATSRVFLAVSAAGAVWVALAVAVLVLGLGSLVAARPQLSRDAVAALLALCAVGVIAAGIVSAAVGEREFHPHESEEEGSGDHGAEAPDDGVDTGGQDDEPATTAEGSGG
jgi:hypothetical protein